MLTAIDELRHLADTLTEAQAAAVLATIRAAHPDLYPDDEEPDPPAVVPAGP